MEHRSPEWFDAVSTALASIHVPGELSLVLRHVVDGAPSHSIVFGGGRARLHVGDEGPDPDVTLSCDAATAVELTEGRLSVPEAVLSGRLAVSGDVTALEPATEVLTAVAEAVRAITRAVGPA